MPQVRSRTATIDYDDVGLGEPTLLFMPGWCAARSAWTPMLDHSASRRRVLSLDWRGHGSSGPADGDFGEEDLVEDALAVIADSGAQAVVPVGLAHAGWVGIELRRRLGHAVPGLVFIDWIVSEAPAEFLSTLEDLRSDADRDDTVAGMLREWAGGSDDPALRTFLAGMGDMPGEMWDRAAREIESSYARHGSPLRALTTLPHSVPALHIMSASGVACSLERQRAYTDEHHWYRAVELPSRSHFPMFEVPDLVAGEIEGFAARVGGRQRVIRRD